MDITKYNPLQAVAGVFRADASGEPSAFLGTCFAFRQTNCFLTANHCVGTLQETDVLIVHPLIRRTLRVEEIARHKTADIALLKSEPIESEDAQSFLLAVSDRKLGTDCIAYGFPEMIFGSKSKQPTARLFKCYFQRFMSYESIIYGYLYEAAELNIACPAGLSGGPVFKDDWTMLICGLVTENLQSTTYLDSVEEIQKDGVVIKKQYQNMINYGVCLMLSDVRDWLNEHIPKSTSAKNESAF